MFIINKYFCCVFVLFVQQCTAYHRFKSADDSPCTTNNEQQGKCVKYYECSHLSKGETPKICGIVNDEPIICCPTLSRPRITLKEKCEQYSKIRCEKMIQRPIPTIYGGDAVSSVRDFPHQVNLGYLNRDNPSYNCGGSLITEEWILTAAHCLNSRAWGRPLIADMGLINLQNSNKSGTHQRINIIEMRPHPLYNSSSRYNDIALLKLEKPVDLSPAVVPACLYHNPQITEKSALATGWGFTETSRRSDTLMKVSLDIYDDDTCIQAYENEFDRKFNGIRMETQFCAGKRNKDTCQGDSGGPLQIIKNHCTHSVIGVTSFGGPGACNTFNGMKQSNKLGVYTRVSHYISWIEKNVI